MIWMQTKAGRVGDMLNPENNVIDFQEIADTLANINRYNGCGHRKQVSVAFHTIICTSMAPEPLKPYMLLHDCHEAFIGDITTPAALALAAVAEDNHMDGDCIKLVIRELKHRHDVAIHNAAGLPMPCDEAVGRIRFFDLRALNTERYEFLMRKPQSWGEYIESAGRDSRSWADNWLPPDETADLLHSLFRQYLPALKSKVAA